MVIRIEERMNDEMNVNAMEWILDEMVIWLCDEEYG